jgi:hypothetical protein
MGKKYLKEHPEHRGKRVRLVTGFQSPGYNGYTVIRKRPLGPRLGLGESRRVGSGNNGDCIYTVKVGTVVTVAVHGNGPISYYSFPALPHDESGAYADRRWEHGFTLKERIESVEWAIANWPADSDPATFYELDLEVLEYQKEQEKKFKEEWGE